MMTEIEFDDIIVENRDLRCRVELEWIGEGDCGDYTGEPDDSPLLRFTVSRWYNQGESPRPYFTDMDGTYVFEDDEWVPVADASYCTQLDARQDRRKLEQAAKTILNHVEGKVADEVSIKKLCEELSWIGVPLQ